jgi:hypothetical protein
MPKRKLSEEALEKKRAKDLKSFKTRHRAFAIKVLSGMPQGKAYLEENPKCKSPDQQASRVMKNDKFQELYKELTDDYLEICGINPIMVMTRLKRIAFSSISNFKKSWTEYKSWDDIPESEKCVIKDIKYEKSELGGEGGAILNSKLEIKLHDSNQALFKIVDIMKLGHIEETEGEGKPIVVEHRGTERIPVSEELKEAINKQVENIDS